MAVASDPEYAHVDPAGLTYGSLVALALGLGVLGRAVGDEDASRVGVDEPVEVLLHVYVVARSVVWHQAEVLVEVEESSPGEGYLAREVHLDEAAIHPEWCCARWQHEDRGGLLFEPACDDVGCGRAHSLVIREDPRVHIAAWGRVWYACW